MKMQKSAKRHFSVIGCAAGLLSLLWGCASMGNPSGGPRDEDPPRFVSANPAPGSVNVDPNHISIEFNELVNVKDAFEKVVLSPPGKSTPRVSTRGRRVIVNVTDTLLPNTTYTIDFGDAIEDNNEANKLSGFAYTFSTGPDLDSLRISGMVLGAEDMEPQQGVFVGAYVSKEDSAFVRMPFQHLARTDEYGRFVIRGLRDTTYRVFALKDLDNDRHYANPEEDFAWFEDVIRPTSERVLAHDTIRDLYTGAVDTIVDRMRTRYLPNNILLRMFNSMQKPQYLLSYTRPDSTRLEFIFNSPGEVTPKVKIVGQDDFAAPLVPERSVGNDTLVFWLPRSIAMRDTLRLALRYPRTELATGLVTMVDDTVKLTKPKPQASAKPKKKKSKKKEDEAEEEAPLPKAPTFQFQAKGPDTDLTRPLAIEAPAPLASLDSLAFKLEENPDSLWRPVKKKYSVQRSDSLSERRFKIDYPWERGMSYRLLADSLAAYTIYGAESEKVNYEFKTKPTEELSNLKITLTGLEEDIPTFVQLMPSGDQIKYTAKVKDNIAEFIGIDPGKYYARIYEDFDGDGKFTPGSYRLQRVFGSPDSIPAAPDSIVVANDSIVVAPDSISLTSDSIPLAADSISASLVDSISVTLPERVVLPLTDRQRVAQLKEMGYSLQPLENDTVGTDILIAIQPDYVYYYPKTINVKKNWDIEQTWNVFETALDLQKPNKIKKNKPKRTGNNTENSGEEEEEEEDTFGTNPFDPNRRGNNRNNSGLRQRSDF